LEKRFSGAALENAQTYEGTLARFNITMDELKETLGAAILPYMQKLAEYGIQIADAFGKEGVAGAMAELKFILKTLLYDENGQLNQVGQTINDLVNKLNQITSAINFGSRATSITPVGIVANRVGGLVGYDPTPTFGQIGGLAPSLNPVLLQRNPENAQYYINIQTGVGDPVSIGKSVRETLDKYDRRRGGR
jgi:hypothetical protein